MRMIMKTNSPIEKSHSRYKMILKSSKFNAFTYEIDDENILLAYEMQFPDRMV
jgi:hypothetical protein